MDSLQKQIIALTHKVDALYQMIDQMNEKVLEAISANRQPLSQTSNDSPSTLSSRYYPYQGYSSPDSGMEHKDVLVDNTGFNQNSHSSSEKELSPAIQVQRLTAQLTAAYNRIAALEEQLLARRIHS